MSRRRGPRRNRMIGPRRWAARLVLEQLEDRCLLTTLTIAQENQLPGTPQSVWDISGAGSPTLQGFATDISVNQGQTVSFKIDDTTKDPYHIDIYRMGYYQGDGARLVTTIPSSQTQRQVQPSPLTDPTTGLIDCGNWSVSASWAVPSDATSGIYFGKLVDETTGAASHIVFIVRDDSSHSDILFQTSDATWEAYNDYGGNSLYVGTAPAGRAYAVSYNRPFDDRNAYSEDFVFNAEYPMVRWLEQNGYDVTYFTDVDSDRYGSLILNHKVFMSVGHDEYWSGGQRANVQAAENAGVDLAFMSGNEVSWKTRWASSIDASDTPYRTLVCYKESIAGTPIDPDDPPTWTGMWRDPTYSPPADGGLPENALTGTISMVNSGATTAIQVPYSDANLRFWRNTSVAKLAPGQTATLGTDTLGYEWDEDLDNGFRPAGLMDMSSTTVTNAPVLQGYGANYAPGTATHSLTLYKASSGALVFGAGTVQWSWGLDSHHDNGSYATDPSMQQATVNLLADMHVQPATLQSGLVAATASTDTTPPTSVITSPANGASVAAGTPVTITGTATDAGGGVVAGVEVSIDGGKTWHPASGKASWSYTFTPVGVGPVRIESRAVDDSGNLETPSAGITVTIPAVMTPYSIFPATAQPTNAADADTGAVEVGMKFRSDVAGTVTAIRFYKGATNTGTHVGDLWSSTGQLLATVTFTGETASGWQQATLATPVAIAPGTTYVVSYHTNVGHYADDTNYFTSAVNTNQLHALANGTDGPNGVYAYSSGPTFPNQSYAASNYWVDVVFQATSSTITPAVTSETPASNATGVPVAAAVTATFNESVQAGSIAFALKDSKGNAVAATLAYSDATHTATLTPSAALAPGTTYTATVSAATDAAGHTLPAPVSWAFTTAAAVSGSYSIFPATAQPTNAADADTGAVEVGMKFRSDVAGTVTAIRFYKGATNTGTHVGDLWSSTGQLLATVTFTGETASGWQQATLGTPVAISPGTTYVVSYHTNVGHYADDQNYFKSSGVDTNQLHALADGADGPDGVYSYGANPSFPSNGYLASNYWVDVVFAPSGSTVPAVTSETPASNATGVPVAAAVTATFNESVQAGSIAFALKDSKGNAVAATLAYSDATHTATLTPSAALAPGTTYTATVSAATDAAGHTLPAPVSWAFTTAAAGKLAVTSETPTAAGIGAGVSTKIAATFSEAMDPTTLTAGNVQVRDASGNPVAGVLSYNPDDLTVTFDAASELAYSATYTATLVGGAGGVKAASGDTLPTSLSWTFTTALAPQAGPGGPILVITSSSSPSTTYLAEILRAEGLNEFATADISSVTATMLSAYNVVVLGQVALTSAQVTTLTNWVNAGGALIAMRPDKQLAGLLGLSPTANTLSNGYLLVNTSTGPGVGITDQTIQYHGAADEYTLNGATSVATLYGNATTATAYPAVTMRQVGTNGGYAVAFTFDLATSIIETRQGNPAWAGEERDGQPPIRPDDLFYGASATDPEPDWVDLNKVAIPQADEQQRLLANLITATDAIPVPRFWYLPNGADAVVLMTGDDHGNGGTMGRFDTYLGDGTSGGLPIRSTSYTYPDTDYPNAITDAEAEQYTADGFEVALHETTDVTDYTSYAQLASIYATQLAQFQAAYPNIPSPSTSRMHAMVWSDWDSEPKVEFSDRIRMDMNYYYWPDTWVQDRPGMFTGSGFPQRFAASNGSLIDVFQEATVMTDESGQTYPSTINALLDAATGPLGYYGVFAANMHNDTAASPGSDAIIASAQAHNVPVMSADDILNWIDGRDGSSFGALKWNASAQTLGFTIAPAVGAGGLEAMLPVLQRGDLRLAGLTQNGATVPFTVRTIKGVDYAFFAAAAGAYVAQYAADTTAPAVASETPASGATGVATNATVSATFNESIQPGTLSFVLRGPGNTAVAANLSYVPATHTATLTPGATLGLSTTYTATISGARDAQGNAMAPFTWSFTTAGPVAGPYSIFAPGATPANPSESDSGAVEVGMKFRSDVAGYITGVRFYKGSANTGTHVGDLWSSTGQLLARVTFTNETASGWQQASFSTPVAISPNTTYIVAYHTNVGHYADDTNFFAGNGVTTNQLHALADGTDGPDGVYLYSSSPGFPSLGSQASNYWVDVVFSLSATPSAQVASPALSAQVAGPATTQQVTSTATVSQAVSPATSVKVAGGGASSPAVLTSTSSVPLGPLVLLGAGDGTSGDGDVFVPFPLRRKGS